MKLHKQPKCCPNVRSQGKPPSQNMNDENDKVGINSSQNQRKSTVPKNSSLIQAGLKLRTQYQNSFVNDLKHLNITLERKQADSSLDKKRINFSDESLYYNCLKKKSSSQAKQKHNGNQLQLQHNLDTLSQILQTQKKVLKNDEGATQGMSFGFQQDDRNDKLRSTSKTLEIKTEQQSHPNKYSKQLNLHSAKEKRVIEIPKYLYGFTCESKATNFATANLVTTDDKVQSSITISQAINTTLDKNHNQIVKEETIIIPSNILLEKRSGGDYFKFDFKTQKKQLQLQFQDTLKFFLSDKNLQVKKSEDENDKTITPIKTIPKDHIVDALIEDTIGICEEFSRDLCQDIPYLTQQAVEDIDDPTKTEKFKDLYKVGSRVGQGAYAAVRLAISLKTNKKVAIKIYEKAKIKDLQRRKGVRREIKLLQKLNHCNIVKIIDTLESNNHINIILEFVGGNSLHSFLKKQQDRKLTEDQCRPLFQQIVSAVSYMHSKSICHRDIKLENILLDESFTIPKLIDLGFSTCIPLERKVKMFCGTPSYMAPEIVTRQEYRGDKADIWALGVVYFALLQGNFPFKGQSDSELYKKIQSGLYDFTVQVSEQSKNLLSSMLNVDAEQRLHASDILKHPWLKMSKKYRPQIAEITLEQDRDSCKPSNHEDMMKNISFITPTNQQKLFEFGTQPKVHSSYLQNQIMKKHQGAHSPFNQKMQIDLNQQINKMQSYTTTNAMLQHKYSPGNNNRHQLPQDQFFFKAQQRTPNQQQNTNRKLSKTQPENGRQKTHSQCLNSGWDLQDQQDHQGKPSYDSDIFHSLSRRGYSPQQIVMKFQDVNSEIGQLYTNILVEKRKHLLPIYPSYVPSERSVGSIRSPSNDMIAKLQQKSRELSREKSKEHNRVQSQPRQTIQEYNEERIRMQYE